MNDILALPKAKLEKSLGKANRLLLERGARHYQEAAQLIKDMPYGLNSKDDDPFVLFEDGCGTCYTKHSVAVIAALELGLKVEKYLCFYEMTETIVTGIDAVLEKYDLPYIPAAHCFLKYNDTCIDLTDDNCNGKNCAIHDYFYHIKVDPYLTVTEKKELLYGHIETTLLKESLKGHTLVDIKDAINEANQILEYRLSCTI